MNNIRIINAANGGFLIHEDVEQDFYNVPIAALSNSGDLLRWMTAQFERPKPETAKASKPIGAVTTPEPEQDGFITQESEWIEWNGGERPVLYHEHVEYQLRNGHTGRMFAGGLLWEHKAWTDVTRYRVVKL